MNRPIGKIWLRTAGVIVLAVALVAAARLFWKRTPSFGEGETALPLEPLKLSELRSPASSSVELREDVRRTLDPGLTLQERIDIAASLAGSMNEWECDALIAGLLETRPPELPAGLHSTWFHAIGSALQSQSAARGRFTRALAAVAADKYRELVYRDYALQHLRLAWEAALDEPDLRASIVRSMGGLVEDPALGASALLSLHTLGSPEGGNSFHLPDEDLVPWIEPVLSEANGDPARLLAALRAAGERRMVRFLPEIRRIAGGEAGSHAMARMAAIASLSRFGDPADRAFLEALPLDDPRIASSVRSALARIPSSSR